MDYSEELEIDKHNLDQEWIDHSSRFMKYMRLEADAAKAEAEAKENRDIVIAQTARAVRDDPERYGIEGKPTNPQVDAAVNEDEDVQEAREELREARHKLAMMVAAVRAFTHRKAALENLVKLQGQGYYSSPTVTGEDAQGFRKSVEEDKEKKVRRKTRRVARSKKQ